MIRRVVTVAALAGITLVAIAADSGEDGGGTYRVDALFDSAKGMVAGQSVKIAGARVGKVAGVQLETTSNGGYKARIQLEIEDRFDPFYADASCRILPEGVISENYIDCDQGDPAEPPLRSGESGVPTVPLSRTAIPASLQDIFDTFPQPTAQRMRLLINELGLATAGRGEDLNAILLRANPALKQARRALAAVSSERTHLSNAIAETDRVLGALSRNEEAVRRFVDRAAAVAETTASRREALGESVRRLPALLRAIDSATPSVHRLTERVVPLLRSLRASAPGLDELNRGLVAFSRSGVPAVTATSRATRVGRTAVPPAGGVVRELRKLSTHATRTIPLLQDFTASAQEKGGLEALLRTLYATAVVASGADDVSHLVGIIAQPVPYCIVGNMDPKRSPRGCDHSYTAPDYGQTPVPLGPSPVTENISPEKRRRDVIHLLDWLLG